MTTLFEVGCIGACAGAMVHSTKTVGLKRAFALFALPFFAGWAMEALAMGLGGYFYPAESYHLWLPGEFPLAIAMGWALTVYVGFLIMRRWNFGSGVLAGAGIDAALEPAALYLGLWTWTASNPLQFVTYFGAPFWNALCWLGFVALMLFALKKILRNGSSVRFARSWRQYPS